MTVRGSVCGLALLLAAPPVLAQTPSSVPKPPSFIPDRLLLPPPPTGKSLAPDLARPNSAPASPEEAPQPLVERLVKFDPNALEARRIDQRWQIWSGRTPLKDFGHHEDHCREALQVIRELRVNQYGSIGQPRPVMEYWLTDGEPPAASLTARRAVPFDPSTLRVDTLAGMWCLRDVRQVLFDMGGSRDDARQAMAVCKKYGFNRIGFVGRPNPSMTFLLVDPKGLDAADASLRIVPDRLIVQPQAVSRTGLEVRGLGYVGERVPIDAQKVELRRHGRDWHLAAGDELLADFGPHDRAGREALRVVRHYRFTDLCRVGDSFRFYLVNGRPPEGTILGVKYEAFRRPALQVQQLGPNWVIREDTRTVFEFGPREEDARQALQLIQHFQFDQIAEVGTAPRSLRFLIKGH